MKQEKYLPYTISLHKHRFAAWAASRATSVIGCRFKVEDGVLLLEKTFGLYGLDNCQNGLPEPSQFDQVHKEWRRHLILEAQKAQLPFTHGVAAKLINVYLKSFYVCGEDQADPKVMAIHPPIDAVLLDALYKKNVGGQKNSWQKARKARWSKFTSIEYENIIKTIKKVMGRNKGLWEIEEYWKGFQ